MIFNLTTYHNINIVVKMADFPGVSYARRLIMNPMNNKSKTRLPFSQRDVAKLFKKPKVVTPRIKTTAPTTVETTKKQRKTSSKNKILILRVLISLFFYLLLTFIDIRYFSYFCYIETTSITTKEKKQNE